MATDPVCGMFVDERATGLHLLRDGETYYFCSEGCLHQFAEPERERRRLLVRLGVAWPLSVAVAVLSLGGPSRTILAFVAVLAAVVQFYPGWTFYEGLRDAIRDRSWNMDVLIATGSTTAFAYSLAVLALPGSLPHNYYFDASALIVTLILTGRYLESLTRTRAGSALGRLRELVPGTAQVVDGGVERTIRVTDVAVGDRLRIRPGERFPADGLVRSGRTSVDESLLTGEAIPVPKSPGDRVLAASINGEGVVEVETTGVGTDTLVAQIGRLLTESEISRVPLQRTADRISAVFVPLVLGLALLTALFWWFGEGAGPTIALLVFVTVVITACPCAFGIATPAAILVGTGRAAEQGVLFRGENAIERAARADIVLTDKTGTLTVPVPELVAVVPVGGATEDDVLALAAGIESGSEHVIAKAVARAAVARDAHPEAVTEIRADPGRGVRGVIDGKPVAVLRGDSALAEGVELVEAAPAIAAAEAAGDGWSAVVNAGVVRGILRVRAPTAPGVREAVASLKRSGIETVMVTGDSERAARTVAGPIGIETIVANATPASKVETVGRYQQRGRHVAFVGDGINDAAALTAADVGIAIGAGSDVSREAGRVILVRSSFSGVPIALKTARRVVARVRGNLAWAIGYNAVLLPVAAGALVPAFGLGIYAYLPILGALAMALSSTTVLLNSLTLRWTIAPTLSDAPETPSARRAPSGPETV